MQNKAELRGSLGADEALGGFLGGAWGLLPLVVSMLSSGENHTKD